MAAKQLGIRSVDLPLAIRLDLLLAIRLDLLLAIRLVDLPSGRLLARSSEPRNFLARLLALEFPPGSRHFVQTRHLEGLPTTQPALPTQL